MAKLNQAMTDLMRYNNAILPKKRSLFDKSHSHATTIDSAWLVPIMWDRVVPGDEKKIRYSGLARMATPLHPTMDECYLYTWAFYIPDRLWWTHAKEFYGENLDASFNPDGEYQMPYITPDKYMVKYSNEIGSLSDYFGLPYTSFPYTEGKYDDKQGVCVGLWRSYQKIWNEYFRNSSIQPALQLNDGDNVTDSEWNVIKQLRRVNKLPDMFTSLLREPQAGDDVLLPLGEIAPVVSTPDEHNLSTEGLMFNLSPDTQFNLYASALPESESDVFLGADEGYYTSGNGVQRKVSPTNLWADLSTATASSINNLRMAITVQQLLEIDSIGGKRYQNLLYAHFGCFTPDATLQRPELLGATKTRIGMRQVLQTSSTTDDSPLGKPSGISVTNIDNEWICNKGFTEPGYIMVLCAVRPLHSYSQGVNPLLRKLNRYDHYYPVFENIGNQPVYTSEIYAKKRSTTTDDDVKSYFDEVFGWKEAWQEYRMIDNRVSGLFRPDVPGSLSSWNYTTNFTTKPFLNSAFISEDEKLIDRTIAVPGEPQFLLDNYFEYHDIKNMGVHSTPGLTRL